MVKQVTTDACERATAEFETVGHLGQISQTVVFILFYLL